MRSVVTFDQEVISKVACHHLKRTKVGRRLRQLHQSSSNDCASCLCSNPYSCKNRKVYSIAMFQLCNVNTMEVIHEIEESSHPMAPQMDPIRLVVEENEVPTLLDINQLAFPQGRLPKGVHLKNALLKCISQIHCIVRRLDVEGSGKQELEASKKANAESKLLLERKIEKQQEAWDKERECMVETHRQELFRACSHSILELKKVKGQLVIEREKAELLAQEKLVLSDQYKYEMEQLRTEIEALNVEVTRLVEDLVNIGQAQVSTLTVPEVPEERSHFQIQLELRDAQILKLEAQVHELGKYNEDLSAQLRQEAMEGLEDDEDLQLEPKSVEPITNTAAID
uniref:Predicted protein n=1 Tax=Physcomitrium patens TaxID=3218 RepID=A9U0B0_PHYPA